ncbi:2OG-Fe(II) oxygenase [Amycolatopsis sp. NPDC003731]
MLDTDRGFAHSTDPFTIHLAENVLSPDSVAKLEDSAPTEGFERIEVLDPEHEKQYAMNLLYLQKDSELCPAAATVPAPWAELITSLRSPEFVTWLEAGTGLGLRALPTDIGVYTHFDGDYISVHKDKPDKALTAILYLNRNWPEELGGLYEVRASEDPAVPPVRSIAPRGGQLLAFPPTATSWHAVSEVRTGGTQTRLTVQLEFWLDNRGRRH